MLHTDSTIWCISVQTEDFSCSPRMLKCVATHHEKGSSVVVLLQELVFALAGLVGDGFAVVA